MLDELDDGARTGVWVALGVVAFVIFGLLFGLVVRQTGDRGAPIALTPVATGVATGTVAAPSVDLDALLDVPIAGDLAGTTYFATGSADLDAQARIAVEAIHAAAMAAPARRLVISGFHDATGGASMLNHDLAKARAFVVRDALAELGVARERLAVRKPESTFGSGPDDMQGRRVEVHLVD